MNKKSVKPQVVHIKNTVASERYEDVFTDHIPDEIDTITKPGGHLVQFNSKNNLSLQISILSDTILRFRYAIDGEFSDDFSYAIDKKFKPANNDFKLIETDDSFHIITAELLCLISKKGLKVRIENNKGEILSEDEKGFQGRSTILKGLTEISISKKAFPGEYYFGLGDKSSKLNLKGKKFENWNTDSFSYGSKSDPLYRSIPFYYTLNKGNAHGIFLDNTYRTFFDFDSNNDETVRFSAAGGEINYYFIYGPELLSVAKQYIHLTGKPELPPIWALGFHQCRWSYFPDKRVLEIAKEFRRREIPCDALYLDIDYMDGFRCFTWDKSRFPNPTAMVRTLREKGFKTIVMIDPGLKVDENYPVYKEAKAKDYLCKRPDGELMIGPVWPSNCVFPDFTNQWVRKWWGHLYAELYSKNRIAGFWNDMNEPAVFKVNKKTFPEDVRHYYEGKGASHAKAHNVYGMQMSRATFNGLKNLKDHRRPFVITRATYSGGQRYSSVWTGDNIASWEHLQIANRQCQRLSISGFSFVGSDIGGFEGTPSGELFVRWLQLGVFHPLYRVHSMGNNLDGDSLLNGSLIKESQIQAQDQEPWSFGEVYEKHAKYAIELRYQLLPYIYTAFWKHTIENTPIIQSLAFYDQNDEKCLGLESENEFLFGAHLLVCPVVKPEMLKQTLYLPKGNWYYYWSGTRFEGQKEVTVDAPLSRIPIFIKEGAVVPHYPIRQYTDEFPVAELTLHVYYKNGKESSHLYEDAGDGFDYKKDGYSLKTYLFEGNEELITLKQSKEGNHPDTYLACNILFYGLPFKAITCIVDDEDVEIQRLDLDGNTVYAVSLGNDFEKIQLKT